MSDRVRELEQTLSRLQTAASDRTNGVELSETDYSLATTLLRETPSALPTHLDPLSELGVNKKYYNWDVVFTEKSTLHQQTYGTSSSLYFAKKMTRYMDNVDKQSSYERDLFVSHTPAAPVYRNGAIFNGNEQTMTGCDLSRSKEETSLSNFWHISDITASLIIRNEFESHYNTLWDPTRALRNSSALADIMLALCLQYEAQSSWFQLPIQASRIDKSIAPDMAGIWWYRRSQQMLIDELEEPSIATFQCHLLSVIWLSNAGRHNTAHSMMASGIRIGIILGLHLEPSQRLPSEQREFRKRLWWSAYALEMGLAMELGRPLAVNCRQVTCTLPVENAAISQVQQTEFLFALHLIKLILASRAVYITFYRHCAEILRNSGKESIFDDPRILERCARFMASRTVYLRTWVRHVPSVLHVQRENGQIFCANNSGSTYNLSTKEFPARRNIVLELRYHNMALNIFRPFITFSMRPRPNMPNTETHALSCARHAIAMTHIIRQVYASTDYFEGSLEVWQWQWSAALSLIGYILAYPTCPVADDARSSIDTAILVLQSCGRATAADSISELVRRAESLNRSVQRPGMTDVYDVRADHDDLQNSNPPITSISERELDPVMEVVDGALDGVSGTITPEHMVDPMLALEDLDVGDCSMFDFLDFDACGYS